MRFPTYCRRALSRIMSIDVLDPVLRRFSTPQKRQTWFNDQYRNPHESAHSIAEVIGWFEANGIQFISSIPAPHLGNTGATLRDLFHQQDCGSRAEMLLSQLLSIPTFSREGDLFIAVGRKLGEAA
jgi:hypothetical protein